MKLQKTPSANPKAAKEARKWLLIDAEGKVLGRLATDVAAILRGKHKPSYTPHVDCGDYVVIVNASKVVLTAGKAEKKTRYHHSGYPGGLSEAPYGALIQKDPARALRAAIRGMLPHNILGKQLLSKLKVHGGPEHPHMGQQPVAFDLPHAAARSKSTGE